MIILPFVACLNSRALRPYFPIISEMRTWFTLFTSFWRGYGKTGKHKRASKMFQGLQEFPCVEKYSTGLLTGEKKQLKGT